jgi:hypothetical protein
MINFFALGFFASMASADTIHQVSIEEMPLDERAFACTHFYGHNLDYDLLDNGSYQRQIIF